MDKVELAKAIATFAHEGQIDKGGNPYIEHPVYVSNAFSDETHKTVALLHDVLEDTFVTESTIRNLFGDEIADAVVALTRADDETYLQFIYRVKENDIAKAVKLQDILHNSELSRIPNPTEKDFKRLNRYKEALKILE